MRSDEIKQGFSRAPHRSLLRATGVKEEDFDKFLTSQLKKLQTDCIDLYLFHGVAKNAFEKIKKLNLIIYHLLLFFLFLFQEYYDEKE